MTRGLDAACVRRLQEANFCSVHNRAKKAPHWGLEKRRSERFFLEEPVVLETQEGQLIGAVVMNYGQSGLYFESDFKAPRGTILHIRNESTLAHPEDGGCCAEVRWSKRLRQQDTDYHYGTGVRYC